MYRKYYLILSFQYVLLHSSHRVLYSGCCLWYFVLLFSSCWSGVELRVMCPVCRMLQHLATRCNRGVYCISYCLLNMFRAPLCPSSGAQEYYTVVAACGISCCGFQVAGLVWSFALCVRFAGCCSRTVLHAVSFINYFILISTSKLNCYTRRNCRLWTLSVRSGQRRNREG